MEAKIAAGSFAGFGWGATMTDTEMVIFSANGDDSALQTYYGVGQTTPQADDALTACYTTTISQADGDFVNFTATRPLDCGIEDFGGDNYVVALDTELSLISAWNPKKSTLSFHGHNYLEFKQTLGSAGDCSVSVTK